MQGSEASGERRRLGQRKTPRAATGQGFSHILHLSHLPGVQLMGISPGHLCSQPSPGCVPPPKAPQDGPSILYPLPFWQQPPPLPPGF